MINTCAPLLPDEVIRRAERLNVPLILDGVKAAKIDIPNGGCMDMEIMPVERGMTVVGTAMTVETANGDNFPIHVASYSVQEDGYVMVCYKGTVQNVKLLIDTPSGVTYIYTVGSGY